MTGDDLNALAAELTGKPGIDMVAPFGTWLHVSGRDVAALEASIAPYREKSGLHWQHSVAVAGRRVHRIDEPFKDNFQ